MHLQLYIDKRYLIYDQLNKPECMLMTIFILYIMYMLWPNIGRNICYIIAQLKCVCIRVYNTTGVTSGAGTLHGGNHVDTYYIVIVNLECSVVHSTRFWNNIHQVTLKIE
jgi:hypothetical protein